MISLFADSTIVCNIGPNAAEEISSDVQRIRKQFDLNELTVITANCEYVCLVCVKLRARKRLAKKSLRRSS